MSVLNVCTQIEQSQRTMYMNLMKDVAVSDLVVAAQQSVANMNHRDDLRSILRCLVFGSLSRCVFDVPCVPRDAAETISQNIFMFYQSTLLRGHQYNLHQLLNAWCMHQGGSNVGVMLQSVVDFEAPQMA